MVWQKKVFAAALECAKHGKLFAAQKQSVCFPDPKTTVCGKCETIELIKWMIPAIYLICRQQGHRVAKTEFGVRGRARALKRRDCYSISELIK